jgi:hypothetical protein
VAVNGVSVAAVVMPRGKMHGGSVRWDLMQSGQYGVPKNAAERVVEVLLWHLRRERAEVGGWDLTLRAEVSAVSTRVSEANAALRGTGWSIACRRDGHKAFYRLTEESR